MGGSGTNDGGAGLLEALGVRFFNRKGDELTGLNGELLTEVKSLETSDFDDMTGKARLIIVSDVNNPLLGPEGATFTYGPQKGADKKMLHLLERGMNNYADVVKQHFRKDYTDEPGAGAAGGLGFCLLSFFNSEIKNGIETVLDLVRFDDIAGQYDLLITGEGKIDPQTLHGKVPQGIMNKAINHNLPIIAVCALSENQNIPGIQKIFTVVPEFSSMKASLVEPERSLRIMIREGLYPWITSE